MHNETHIKRLADGSIDLHHYTARGRRLHGEAVRTCFGSIFAWPGRVLAVVARQVGQSRSATSDANFPVPGE